MAGFTPRDSISATRLDLDHWMRSLPQPWSAAMEADDVHGLDLRLISSHMRSR